MSIEDLYPSIQTNSTGQHEMSDYLNSLPTDLLHHLTQAGWLEDVDVVAFATTNHTNLVTIGSRYERASDHRWFLYFLSDVKLHFRLPWTNVSNSESEPYLLTSPLNPSRLSGLDGESEAVVILRHTIPHGLFQGWTSLPLSSFVLKEYQRTPYQIGHITNVIVRSMPAPESDDEIQSVIGVKRDIHLNNLSFIPFKTIKRLTLDDGLINRIETITTAATKNTPMDEPIWPKRLESMELHGVQPAIFSRETATHWPSSLARLILDPDDNSNEFEPSSIKKKSIKPEEMVLPSSLQALVIFDKLFEFPRPNALRFPLTLTSLLCTPLHPLRDWRLPVTLETLALGDTFNLSVDGWVLPNELSSLEFGQNFNQSIKMIKFNDKLSIISFGELFDQSLIGVSLPPSLTSIQFGYEFRQTLLGVVLPPKLRTLQYSMCLDPSVRNPLYWTSLPVSLTSLQLGYVWSNEADEDEMIDEALDDLVEKKGNNQTDADLKLHLLVNLDHLQLPLHLLMEVEQLPPALRELSVGCGSNFDRQINFNISALNHILASATQLAQLTIDDTVKSLDGLILPNSLEQFEFGPMMNAPLNCVHFGSHLTSLSFVDAFNQSLVGVKLPVTLKVLRFGLSFNQPMDQVILPDGLESLHFDLGFNHPLKNLPSHLKILELSRHYDTSLDQFVLPPELERFDLGDIDSMAKFTHLDSLIHLTLPHTLQSICLPHPLQIPYQTHSSQVAYQAWVNSLSHSHPYLRLQFTRRYDDDDPDEDDHDEEVDSDGEEYEDGEEWQ